MRQNPYLPLAAIILGVMVLQFANGVFITTLPIRLALEGASDTAIGVVATGQSVGFLIGCLFAGRLIRAIGHIRAFALLTALTSATALAFTIKPDPILWTMLRGVLGFCSAGLFTVAESWLQGQTPTEARGRVVSVYMIVQKMALASGQAIVAFGDPRGLVLFMIGSAFYSLAAVPVTLNRASNPSPPEVSTLPLRRLYGIAPAAAVGCFVTGLLNTPVINLGPLYGQGIGLDFTTIGLLLAALQIGSLVMQWPLGWLSDRIDRRKVIVGASLGISAVSFAIAVTGAMWEPLLVLLFFVWGGVALSIYAICIAHANDFAPEGMTVALSGSLLMCWAVGSVCGPLVATSVMEAVGPAGLFVYTGTVSVALAAFVGWRMTRRAARPAEEREPFVNLPATSIEVMKLAPRQGSAPPSDSGEIDRPRD